MKIQKILKKELESLQYIAHKSFLETYAALNSMDKMNHYLENNMSLAQFEKEIKNSFSEFYFAKIDGIPVGYLKLNFGEAQTESTFENAMEIERIYVLKQFQKQKIGISLYNKAYELAIEQKLERIWLGVWVKNPKAIAFYKKQGFKECGTHIFQFVDEAQTDLLMELKI